MKIYLPLDSAAVALGADEIADAIQKAFPCKRCGISVIGLEVAHAHLHLVPIKPDQNNLAHAMS
jgi:histidine triad (HIT) family protein